MGISSNYLTKLHVDLLTIMDEIDRVCKENELHYYLIGGTLLGAVRHKGFIPWDDDLDIVMPREDLNKFIKIADNALKENFRLEWITTNKSYFQIFPKVSIKETVFKEDCLPDWFRMGIFVDIFPLDYTSEYCDKIERIKKRVKRLRNIALARTTGSLGHQGLIFRFLGLFFSNTFLLKRVERILQSANELGHSHFANFGSQYALKKQTMPVDWYGEGIPVPFEDRVYIAPAKKENVLESIFGPNYMQLPPENKRRTHYPVYVRFSDGESIRFDRTTQKVSINDQGV